ncbi:MAG: hypothetical protein CVT68_12400, partial [Actinobacteria bacterium HGW-Actinobacteria-8]
ATPQQFADRLAADFGTGANAVDVLGMEAEATILGVRPGADSPQARAALAAWAVATASDTGVTWVEGNAVVVATDGSIEWLDPTDEANDYAGIRVAVAAR